MPELTPAQRAQLDNNIKSMLAGGASQEDIVAYAADFRAKYDTPVKKKEVSVESALSSAGAGASAVVGTSRTAPSSFVSDSEAEGQTFDTGITSLPLQIGPAKTQKTTADRARKPQPGFTETIIGKVSGDQPVSLIPTPDQKRMYSGMEDAAIKNAEAIASDLEFKASIGTINAKELSDLYQSPKGREYVRGIIQSYAPELAGETGLDKEVFRNEHKWKKIEQAINEKNRGNGVLALDKKYAEEDAQINQILSSATAQSSHISGGTGGAGFSMSNNKLSPIDLEDPGQYANVISMVKSSDQLIDDQGNPIKGGKENLLKLLNNRAMRANMKPTPDEEIDGIEDKLKVAITRVNINRERGENIDPEQFAKYDENDLNNVKAGLKYAKTVDPAKYKNVIRAITNKEMIADTDFRSLALIGQQINNEQTFRDAATDPGKIGKETDFEYVTRQDKKAMYAGAIGEYLKAQGFTNVRQFSKDQIRQAAANLNLNNADIVNELAEEERILGYDAIPKSGKVEAFVRGLTTPFEGIRKTVNAITDDESDTYLATQQYDVGIGGQKVVGKDGQLSTRLASDRGNVWYDVMEGFGQFIPQVLLAKGIGGTITRGVNAIGGAEGALTAQQAAAATNLGGTFISTYLQEYGSSYEEALQKTGSASLARSMGAINGIAAASFELFLPDTKIADRAAGIFRKNYAGDIIDVIKQGGSVTDIAKKGRPIIDKFVRETVGISGQEVSEEVATNVANYLTESIFSPRTAVDRDLSNEILETARATAVSMLIPSVLGGAGSARRNSDFTVNGLHSAAINFETYKNSLDRALIDDQIDQNQYNKGIQMLKTHRESIGSAPMENNSGKVLSESERLEFAYQDTMLKAYAQEMESAKSDILKEDIQVKIDRAKDVQRQILLPGSPNALPEQDQSWKRRVISLEEERAEIDTDTSDQIENVELTQQEQAAIDGLAGKQAEDSIIKPYLTVIQNPESSLSDKREALRGLSDQLTAAGTSADVGLALGRQADLIYDLGYPEATETEGIQNVVQNAPTEITNPALLAAMQREGIIQNESVNQPEPSPQADRPGPAVIMPADEGTVNPSTFESGAAAVTPPAFRSSAAVTMPTITPAVETRGAAAVMPPPGQESIINQNTGGQNAIQEQNPNEGLLRNEGIRGEGQLQEMVPGNEIQEPATAGPEVKPEVTRKPKTAFAKNAYDVAAKIRENGLRSALPSWAKVDIKDGDQVQGFGGKSLDEAIARAIEIVADAVDALPSGADISEAIESGYQSLKDYYTKNTSKFNEARVRGEFERNVRGMFDRAAPRSQPTDDSGENTKNFNYFKNRDLTISGEKAQYLSKPTIENSGTEITQPFDYDVKELDEMMNDGKRWIDEARLEFNKTPIQYATILFRDLRAMRGRMAVKAVGMVSLMNSVDLDLRYSDLTDGERGTLRSIRQGLELEIAKNAREGSLTLNAQRLIHKLYKGEYKTSEAMEEMVGKDVQNMADYVTTAMKSGTEDISEAARSQKRREDQSEDLPPRGPKKAPPKPKKSSQFKDEMTDEMKKKSASLKKEITDLANKVNCRKTK